MKPADLKFNLKNSLDSVDICVRSVRNRRGEVTSPIGIELREFV